MKRIQMETGRTIAETFEKYIAACRGRGLSEKTPKTYCGHFHGVKCLQGISGTHQSTHFAYACLEREERDGRAVSFFPFPAETRGR